MLTEQEWADHERDLAHEAEHEEAMSEPDDLLTTVKAALAIVPELHIDDWSMAYTDGLRTSRITGRMLRALVARCEEAEDERDAARAEVARLRDARADDVALVARLSHQVVALRNAVTRVLDGPHYIDRDYQDVLLAALDTPAREGA